MTDSERLADIRAGRREAWVFSDEGTVAFLLRLLDTTRSERDAALARVGELEEASGELCAVACETFNQAEFTGRLFPGTTVEIDEVPHREILNLGRAADRLYNLLHPAALTPPAYPPEQPL